MAAVGRTSAQSLYRCFLGAKRDFSEREIDFFVHPDFVDHVALVAVVEEGGNHPSWPAHATLSFSPAAQRWPSRWSISTKVKASELRSCVISWRSHVLRASGS